MFRNQLIDTKWRYNFGSSLVLSMLIYHCATWSFLNAPAYNKLDSFYHRSLTGITAIPGAQRVTFLETRRQLTALELTDLMALRRLAFSRRVMATQAPWLLSLVYELRHDPKTWPAQIAKDLEWLCAGEPGPAMETPRLLHLMRVVPAVEWIARLRRRKQAALHVQATRANLEQLDRFQADAYGTLASP